MKKILALILTLIMVIQLAACGGEPVTLNNPTPTITPNDREFSGKWITNSSFDTLEPVLSYGSKKSSLKNQNSHILFRKTFDLSEFEDAKIYISADDYYKLYINGEFVSKGPAPSYNFHYNYNEIDVSEFLHEGENLIAVHTYYQGLINRVWVSGDNRHGLIMDLDVDGKNVVKSDESFLTKDHDGFKILDVSGSNDTQFLERYDAGAKQKGFETVGFDDSDWDNAKLKQNTDYGLVSQLTQQLVIENIEPVETTDFDENNVIIDFGKNYVGSLNLEVNGKKGDELTILYGQEMNDDGNVRYEMRANSTYEEKMKLTGENDTLEQFDYKAFRYVQIKSKHEFDIENIQILAQHYPFELKAEFETDDEDLQKIWDLCIHTMKYGVQDTIQDCPDREKGFYLGDGCYTALTHYILTGNADMFKKLIDDAMRSDFICDTLVTCMDCSFKQEIAEFPLIMIIILNEYYNYSKDIEFVEKHFDNLVKLAKTYETKYLNEKGLLQNLDKWCVVEWPDNFRDGYDADLTQGEVCTDCHCVINAYFYETQKALNSMAKILGEDEIFDTDNFKEIYLENFFDEQLQQFTDTDVSEHSSLISNMFSYAFGLCPDEETSNKMIQLIREKSISSVNMFTAFPVMYELKESGKTDILLELIKDENAWLNMIDEGATTTFETWGKDLKWNTSLFHLTLSYVAMFLLEV